jgi:hypothetical protein
MSQQDDKRRLSKYTLKFKPEAVRLVKDMSRWSSGAGPAAHFASAAQRATPSAPA